MSTGSATGGPDHVHEHRVEPGVSGDLGVERRGEQTALSASLNSLLLLALGCYLAGVHMEWLFMLAGALLTLILVVFIIGEQYLPFLFGVGVVIIVLMVVVHRYFRVRAVSPPHAPPAAPAK